MMRVNVMVVEDEPFILKTVKQMIENMKLGFNVVETAHNGEVALGKIAEAKPDVLFTDIRMPVMDGLDLIRRLRSSHPDIVTVVISGFQDFEYARQALKLGVHDYLLKPLSPSALETLLKDIRGNLQEKKREDRRKWLTRTVNGFSGGEAPNKLGLAGLFPYASYMCMLMCAGSCCSFASSGFTAAKEFWFKHDLEKLLLQVFQDGDDYWVLDGSQGNERIVIAGYTEEATRSALESGFAAIHGKLLASGVPLTSVVRHAKGEIAAIGPLLQAARITLNKRIEFARSNWMDGDDEASAAGDERTLLLDKNTEKLLELLIQNDQDARLKAELLRLFRLWDNAGCKQLNLERLLKQIIGIFFTALEAVSPIRTEEIDMEIDELIGQSISYDTLYEELCGIVDDLFRLKKAKTGADDTSVILTDKVEQYIQANYSKQINLQSICLHFQVAPQYLRRTYRRAKGMSPTDRLIQLRIGKVKELLALNPPVTLKEIAEATGFNDPFYLSKVFKAATGKSPKEWRGS